MSLRFHCTSCGRQLAADMKNAGQKVRCPACRAVVVIPNDSPAHVARTSTKFQASTPDSPTEERAGRKRVILIAWGSGVAAALVTFLFVGVHFSNNRKAKERERLTKLVESQIATTKRKVASYDFESAVAALDDVSRQLGAQDFVPKTDATICGLIDEVEGARRSVQSDEQAHAAKLRAGYVVFEGRLVLRKERDKILTKREETAAQEKQQAEAIAREAETRKKEDAKAAEIDNFAKIVRTTGIRANGEASKEGRDLLRSLGHKETHDNTDAAYAIEQALREMTIQPDMVYVVVEDGKGDANQYIAPQKLSSRLAVCRGTAHYKKTAPYNFVRWTVKEYILSEVPVRDPYVSIFITLDEYEYGAFAALSDRQQKALEQSVWTLYSSRFLPSGMSVNPEVRFCEWVPPFEVFHGSE